MDEDDLYLSESALQALKLFAVERGINVTENQDVRETVQSAIDAEQPKEDTFEYEFGAKDDPERVQIHLQGLRRDIGQTLESTGLTLWRAADVLSNYIYQNRKEFEQQRCLELGAGLGLCGLLASHYCSEIIITDGDSETMKLLRENCKQAQTWLKPTQKLQCRPLLWELNGAKEAEADVAAIGQFDIVLGSDIIYEADAVGPLFQTAKRHLKTHDGASFLLAYTKRNVSIDYVLEQSRQAGLQCVTFPPQYDEGMYRFTHETSHH